MFDSQNNNNGGYNVGDATKDVAKNMGEQHKEIYFQSGTVGKSYLTTSSWETGALAFTLWTT